MPRFSTLIPKVTCRDGFVSLGSACLTMYRQLFTWLWFIMVKSGPQRAWRNHIYRAGSWVTYKDDNCYWVVCRWKGGRWVFSQWGRLGKTSVKTSSNRFLKTLTEGAVTTEAGSLFQRTYYLSEPLDPWLIWIQGWECRMNNKEDRDPNDQYCCWKNLARRALSSPLSASVIVSAGYHLLLAFFQAIFFH